MKQMVNLTIDGQAIEARAGQTILEAATETGIRIPALCHHPALKPIGACRMCLIEISRYQPLYPACTYEVSEGLAVTTRNERIDQARRFVLDMLFSERNHYCMYCEMSGNCELQDLGYEYGLDHWAYPTYTERFPVDAGRDTFLMDHNRCILCRRCVRACGELVANHTLGMRQRGAKTMISADLNLPFGDSSCVGCGTCLQVCPTGALIDKRSAYLDMGHKVELERVKSTCSQCSVGCGVEILTRGGNIVRVEGDWDATPNGGVLCQKGRFDPLYDRRSRITAPMIRTNGSLQTADWETALGVAARRLSEVPGSQVGVISTSYATNEALYMIERLFGKKLGADKIELLDAALPRLPAHYAPLSQIAESDLLLVTGANPVKDQPVASFLLKRAVDRGARLIIVDGPHNPLIPFAHMSFEMADLEKATGVAAHAESPLVLYGRGVAEAELAKLQGLEHVALVGLEPGGNTRGAAIRGLNGKAAGKGIGVTYVLLGEQAWTEAKARTVAEDAFLIVQASYESPLTQRADVVLPAAVWSERSGTLTNLEGNLCKANQAVEPIGKAKADWEILTLLADKLGHGPVLSLTELSALAAQGLNE